jgi:hypothetical protein
MIKKWNEVEKEIYEALSEDAKKYFLADGEEYLPISKFINPSDEDIKNFSSEEKEIYDSYMRYKEEFQKKAPENWGIRSDGSIAILEG